MSRRPGPRLVAVLALLGTAAIVAAVAAGGPASPGAVAGPPGAADPLDANATVEIQLQADGDARWTVTTWFALEDAVDRSTYRRLAERFDAGDVSDLGLSTFEQAQAAASQATGRDMAIADVSRATATASTVANGTGRLSVSFTWTNFARAADNGTLAVGDAFRLGNGTWFSSLTANQTLIVRPPPGYSVTASTVPISNGALRWEGPRSLGPDALAATFSGSGPPPEPPTGGTSWVAMAVVVIVLLGIVLVGGYLVGRDRDWFGVPEEEVADPAPPEPDEAAEPETEAVDVELLSDEERVERLLEANGGRMKQATIVKETGWSNAKVSQLLSAMAEEGRIDKLRIGRENLISFPDEDVTDVDP